MTYTGGLVKTPQIRSLAEQGPELVLNAEDTKNILSAVRLMRETVAAQTSSLRLSSIPCNTINNIIQPVETPVAQDVKIEATFPNVSVASEIETALNNLVNEAVQYAERKN